MSEIAWRGVASDPPPIDEPIWAFLHEKGIRQVRWATVLEIAADEGGAPEDYDPCWVEVQDFEEDHTFDFWLPLEAIPEPAQ